MDTAACDCTKSSNIFYVWATLLEATLWRNGPFRILGMASSLG